MPVTLTRAQFVQQFSRHGGIQLHGVRDQALRSALERLQDDGDRDGVLSTDTELNRAFDYIDRFDRNGDRESFAVHHRTLECYRAMVESNAEVRGSLDSSLDALLQGVAAGAREGNPELVAGVLSTTAGDGLANKAETTALSGSYGAGYCYRAVKRAVREGLGVELSGASAYMAAGQLAQSSLVAEVEVPTNLGAADLRAWLRTLPPGAIMVFGASDGHPHGHISIRTSNAAPNTNGRAKNLEASDTLRDVANPGNYKGVRVFMPTDLGSAPRA